MSVATPTVLPRDPVFPLLLPKPPQPHPLPHQKSGKIGNLNGRRDLQKEMDDLSDEENELEDMNLLVHNRGFNFLIPIGRTVTQQEERNDADEDTDDSGNSQSGGGLPSAGEDDGENDSAQDLDATMEDMDAEDDEETDEDDMAEDDDEYEEEPSDV